MLIPPSAVEQKYHQIVKPMFKPKSQVLSPKGVECGLREAFKKKNDETYGIFHMLVDPPPLPTYGKFFHDFLLSKKDF